MTRALTLWFAAAAGPAAAADPPADRAALVGTWKITVYQDDGGDRLGRLGAGPSPKKGEPDRVAKLVFTTDECWVIRGDGTRDRLAGLTNCAWKSVALDPGADPKRVEIVGVPAKDEKEKKYAGIYKLEDKKLTVVWNETPRGTDPDKIRPKKFESDGDMNMFVCEKISDVPEKPKE